MDRMLGAILSDTGDLKSDTTVFADCEAVKTLSDIAEIPDTDTFYIGIVLDFL